MRIKIDPLDKLFSQYIRLRAMTRVDGCERCLTGKVNYKSLHCAHFDGRGHRSIRWDEDNAAGLCPGCHIYLDSHPLEKVEWFKKHLGEESFNLLQHRARMLDKPDKKLFTVYYQNKIKELEGWRDKFENCQEITET